MALFVARAASTALDAYDDDDSDGVDPTSPRNNVNKIKLKRSPDKPTDVYSWFEITLQDIDVPSQTFQASIEVHLFWQDYNLPNIFPNYEDDDFEIHDDYVPVKMSEIFENKTAISEADVSFKYYYKTGTIYMMFVVECTFVERMELQRFPLDRQFMNMEFNALIQPTIETEGPWNWILEYPEWMPLECKDDFDKPFAVRMISSITEYELLEPWVDFSGEQPLSIRLRVNRLPAYYFGNIIFPNFLIVAGCFSAFVIPKEEIADRLSVTVTLMLAAVAFRFVVSTMLPKVSYLTLMDYYLLLGFVALILLVIENAIAGIGGLEDIGGKIDLWCAIIFGGIWILVHIIGVIALLRKECLRVSWEKMDEIDQAEDEEAEFIYADKSYVRGKEESNECINDWKKYKKYTPLERANQFAKAYGITRSNTFTSKLKQQNKAKKAKNSPKPIKEESDKDDDNDIVEIVVPPSKIPNKSDKSDNSDKADYTSNTEKQIASSIELSKPKPKPQDDPKYEPVKQDNDPPPDKIDNKPDPVPDKVDDPPPDKVDDAVPDQVDDDYVKVDEKADDNDNDKQDDNNDDDNQPKLVDTGSADSDDNDNTHGYTQTMIVNDDKPSD